MKKKTVCLNMIVKNERHIIQRCFDSLKNHIDYWVISDTGSEDGTQAFIETYFAQAGIPGELLEHPWKNFAHNRNLALQAALGKADYILFMDADDYIDGLTEQGFSNLEHDAYFVNIALGATRYSNIKLVKSGIPWYWEGVLHEYITAKQRFFTEQYSDDNCVIYSSSHEGSRSSDPDKYKKDAETLEKALLEEPNNTRYQFYLARSYYDCEEYEKALVAYRKRALMSGWEEEVYYAWLGVAYCKEQLGHENGEVINAFMHAYNYRPTRLEALYGAIRVCREKGLFELGYRLGSSVDEIKVPADILFVDSAVYDWRFLDEYSICAIEAGNLAKATEMIKGLLSSGLVPPEHSDRLNHNLKVATNA